jgi:hypothetical protein
MLQPFNAPPVQVWDLEHPWNRQPYDIDRSWYAFRHFLGQAHPRNIDLTARAVGLSTEDVETWAVAHHWRDRVLHYDNYVLAQYNETFTARIVEGARERADRFLATLDNGLEIVEIELKRLLESVKASHAHGNVKPSDLIRLLETCMKWKQLLTGGATSRVELQAVDEMIDALDANDLEALREVQLKLTEAKK